MKNLLAFLIFATSCTNTKILQERNSRVDSYFNEMFSILQAEARTEKGLNNSLSKSNRILVSEKDSVYILQGIAEALVYMEKITHINAPVKNPGQYTSSKYVDLETLKRWQVWYSENRSKLIWDNKSESPKIKR